MTPCPCACAPLPCFAPQVMASDLDRKLDELSEALGARPLDAAASQALLREGQAGCKAAVVGLLAARDQLATSQVRPARSTPEV